MKIGICSDIHDNVDNLRHAVNLFNSVPCDAVLFAGDFVSPLVVPSMRKLRGKVIACYGDNDGNRIGIAGGMKIVGTLAHTCVGWQTADGVRILMAHQLDIIRDFIDEADVVIFGHTHRTGIVKDRHGRLFINPGEIGGWMFRKPSVVLLDTETMEAETVMLPEMPAPVYVDG